MKTAKARLDRILKGDCNGFYQTSLDEAILFIKKLRKPSEEVAAMLEEAILKIRKQKL